MAYQTKLGFTGTRDGMVVEQRAKFRRLARLFYGEFHYGRCVGSDEQAAKIIDEIGGFSIHDHPPTSKKYMSNFKPRNSDHVVYPPGGYVDRDYDIVQSSKIMVATPKGKTEIRRGSGTWVTIRMSRAELRPLAIIYPDGSIEYERWPRGIPKL